MSQKKVKNASPVLKNEIPSVAIGQSSVYWYLLGILIVGIGMAQAINLRWVSDDAFITFRYVQNFVAGHGIVYNVGEYVEGYTHFLWLLILSAAKSIGFDPVESSMNLGIAAYAAILVIYVLISKKESQQKVKAFTIKCFLPLAAILLALNYDMNVWATGGLETSLYTLFISLAFYCWFYTDLEEKKKIFAVGSILLLATLTRPDGVLFIITAMVLLIAKGIKLKTPISRIFRTVFFLVLPSIIIGIPYLLWKYNYYGDILPTTFYAKSADQNYFGQGVFYISLFFKVYFSAALAIVLFAVAIIIKKPRFAQAKEVETNVLIGQGSPIITISAAIVVYLVLNVARVGGDFMFARFVIPVLPLIYLLVEYLLFRLPVDSKYKVIIPIVFIASILFENKNRENILFHFDEKTQQLSGNWDGPGGGPTQGIADERWVYMRKRFFLNGVERGSMDVYCDIGKYYEPFFAGLPVTVSITGAQNMIAYYAKFKTCILEFGLTDNFIAHMPITHRGRIGHEKMAPEEYLIKRGVQIQFFSVMPNIPEQRSWDMAAFEIPEYGIWQMAKVLVYDKPVVDELFRRFRAAGIRTMLPKYEMIMPLYIKNTMPSLPADQVKDDYESFKRLFFNRYPDPAAQKQIEDYIAQKSKS